MSLFSAKEICKGCELAVFHECCGKFCHCADDNEGSLDGISGRCEYRIVQENIES